MGKDPLDDYVTDDEMVEFGVESGCVSEKCKDCPHRPVVCEDGMFECDDECDDCPEVHWVEGASL